MGWRLFRPVCESARSASLTTVVSLLSLAIVSSCGFIWLAVREPSDLLSKIAPGAETPPPFGATTPSGGFAPPAGSMPPPGAEMAMRSWSYAYHARMMVESPQSKMHQRGVTDIPLAKDSPLPPLEAPGWLNGVLSEEDIEGKVVVVDVWDGGCPYCSMSAPSLLEAYNKYHDKGVVFVGITSGDAENARKFVEQLHLPWPNAYDAGDTVDKLGANGPTVFVVGSDGRVAWNDGKARFKHDLLHYGERLGRAIQQAAGLP